MLGRRPDGYHAIESVMQTITLADRLTVRRSGGSGVRLEVRGRPCPAGPENLAVRAAETFFSHLRRRFGLDVILEKRVPLGAGLGGGSADAAAMLLALNHLAGRPFSQPALESQAAELGSDVPFFLTGGTAIARGRGERIAPLPAGLRAPHHHYVLFHPGEAVPTARVYGSLKLDLTINKDGLQRFLTTLDRSRAGGSPAYRNALQAPFRSAYPHLAALQDRLTRETGHAFHLTGSGSTLFAHVLDRGAGDQIMHGLLAVAAGEAFLCESAPSRADEEGGGGAGL